ncbi:YidC/Oxa1 family membrane protein insertase [Candidatus Avoscillospira sp. LCP25S3_F1]|uniref:YidC/Oxa1 family membrane protein insertase n=1 Tax=Candidatus Avoscillospira sp. LCP25S3_F1 TaxID=3438825 RepID=UPI003F9114C2
MTSIADIIRIPFGYVLEFLYNFSGNYGLALILFGIAIKLILLPVSAKSKKSMMKMSRMAPRVKALEAKYGDDKTKYQMEVMKLYKKEGVSTTGGCLWAFIPLLILIPLYQVIREPMVYMMHLSREQATEIVNIVGQHVELGGNTYYHQLAAASYLGQYVDEVKTAIPALANVDLSPINFSFLGVNLGKIPTWQFWTLTGWAEIGLFLMPVISAASQWFSMFVMQKFNASVATNNRGEQDNDAASAVNQSMKSMNIIMPVMSLWIGFSMPAGMSVYWITQGLFGLVQEFFLTKHYRKVYDAEDEIRRQEYAEEEAREAEKERLRAERRAKLGDAADPNTSKKKLAAKEKAERANQVEGKLTAEQKEALRLAKEKADEERHFSGIEDRPYCRGRAYQPQRYGRNTSQANLEEE